MYKYKGTKDSGGRSWLMQRITGLALVVLMIGHYVLMHYTPESGHTYDAVLGRMQYSWYRIIDITFVTLAMYHGLNGVWGVFRDYKLKTWQSYSDSFRSCGIRNSIRSLGLCNNIFYPLCKQCCISNSLS